MRRRVSEVAGAQFGHSPESVLLRRAIRAPSGLPQFMGQRSDFIVAEGGDAVSNRCLLPFVMGLSGRFVELRRMHLVRRRHTMFVLRQFFQFRGTLVVLVMRSVVITRRHTTYFARIGPNRR